MDVYALCFRLLGSPQDAEDAVQETFLALFRDAGKLAEVASVRAFVMTVARNTAVSLGRRRRPALPLTEGATDAPPLEEPPDRARLDGALRALSDEDRHLIQMLILEGKNAEAMAAGSRRTVGSVATALCRALGRLRSLYWGNRP